MPNAVTVQNLVYRYDEAEALSVEAFALAEQCSCAVIGPSGSGKTTLVHLLAGLLTPQTGQVEVMGADFTTMTQSQIDRHRGQNIGFVFQRLHLIPALTVWDNLKLAQRLARSGFYEEAYLEGLLAQLGVDGLRNRRPHQLSIGQLQRVAVARSLAHRPKLLIADEPTSALDDKNAESTIALLRQCADDAGAALLVVTHDQRLQGHLDEEFTLGNNA